MLNGRQFCSHSRCFFYGISWQDFLWINHSCWLQAEMFDKFSCRRFSFGIGGLSYGWWGWGGHWRTFTSSRAVFRLRAKDQTRTQSLFCMRCDLWEGFSEFGVHQWKDGRKTRSDWQIKEIFLHKSIISCKHQYFTFFFLPFLVFFTLLIIFTDILQASKRKQWNNVFHRWIISRTISNANDTQATGGHFACACVYPQNDNSVCVAIWWWEIENSREVTVLLTVILLVLWIPYFPTKNVLRDKKSDVFYAGFQL